MGAIQQLALDLAEGRVDLAQIQELASKLLPDQAHQSEVASLLADAIAAYEDRKPRRAWAAGSVAAAMAKAWIDRPTRMWPRRIALREFSLDVRGRALALLSFIADAGHEDEAAALGKESDVALQGKKLSSTSARFRVAAMAADPALRLRDAEKELATIEQALRLPSLTDHQRGVGLTLRATALRSAGRLSEADEAWHHARLTELALDGSDLARQHVQDKLNKVSSLRQRLSRLGA